MFLLFASNHCLFISNTRSIGTVHLHIPNCVKTILPLLVDEIDFTTVLY
jgi:hypothetical protein